MLASFCGRQFRWLRVAVCLIANANVHGSSVSLSELNRRLVPNLPEQQEPARGRRWLCQEARIVEIKRERLS
jgi:hypothetical protein